MYRRSEHTTRRGFLRKAALAGGCLAAHGLAGAAPAAQPAGGQPAAAVPGDANQIQGVPGIATGAPITVITQSASTGLDGRARAWIYILEILRRAGLFFEQVAPAQLTSPSRRIGPVVLLAGHLPLTSEQRGVLAAWVKNGGSLIGIGGTSGLDEVFGVSGATPLSEGWLKITAPNHPVTAGLRSSLHVFGGYVMKAASATSLAQLESGNRRMTGSTILENRLGKGRAILLSADVIFSIVHIQQGLPVFQDGRAAPDDSAPLNDGVLKAEDGLVLDWQRDRQPMAPEGAPAFLQPVSDELRELILRSIFHVAGQQGIALPVLWYWPRCLKAVGEISHDTDGNDPKKAAAMLEVLRRCNVKSTWCTQYPGGYPREFYRTLQKEAFEIALHYDAMAGGERTSWSRENFVLQHRWLLEEAGIRHITSNKNHYTRWEGRLDFLRWCEELGIESDQTRGPSKKGTIGFPLGGSQPYYPLDDEAATPRFLPVLEVNLQTQDLVVVCPAEYGKQLLDSALRHHGVAHFLFHPAHIVKPGVADALRGVVDYGRAQGMEWWTNAQICQWEKLRRGVELQYDAPRRVTLRAARPLSQATLLFLKTRPEPQSVGVNGQPARTTRWTMYGFEFDAVTVDMAGEVKVQVA